MLDGLGCLTSNDVTDMCPSLKVCSYFSYCSLVHSLKRSFWSNIWGLPRTLRALRGLSRTTRMSWKSGNHTNINKTKQNKSKQKLIKAIEKQRKTMGSKRNLQQHQVIRPHRLFQLMLTKRTVPKHGPASNRKVRANLKRWTHVKDVIRG